MFGLKMWLNNFCFVLFVCFVTADDPKLPKNTIINEIPCLTFGGTCMPKSDCPSEKVAESSLCPVQATDGIECCHSKSTKEALNTEDIDLKAWRSRPSLPHIGDYRAMPFFETRCKYRGGECTEKNTQCSEKLIFEDASDCTPEQKCCIFVN